MTKLTCFVFQPIAKEPLLSSGAETPPPSHQANLHPLQSPPGIPSDAPYDLTPTLSHHCDHLRSSCDSTGGANEETDSPRSRGLGALPPLPCCWGQRAYREIKCTIFAINASRAIFHGASFFCPCSSSALVGPGYQLSNESRWCYSWSPVISSCRYCLSSFPRVNIALDAYNHPASRWIHPNTQDVSLTLNCWVSEICLS